MRLFIAIDIEGEVKEKVFSLISDLKKEDADVNWTSPDNLHITLKFLGEVSEDSVKEIENRIAEALSSVKMFSASLEGVGFFGSAHFPRVLWVGVKQGREKVVELMKMMNAKLDHIRKDEYPPNAHLTLGRITGRKNIEMLLRRIEDMKDVKLGECEVKEIKLKKSVLTSQGPAYSDVKVFVLGK